MGGVLVSDLERIRMWLMEFPGMGALERFWVDHYPAVPDSGSLAPLGVKEVERREDILGNVTVVDRYGFALWFVLPKAQELGAQENARWVLELQRWVQEQSAAGKAPVFGDVPEAERIWAEDGTLERADAEGLAVYRVRLYVRFLRVFPA